MTAPGKRTEHGGSVPTHNRVSCRGCSAPIRWEQTDAGVWTPVNPDGTPHWATCSDPALFRRRERAAAGQLSLFGAQQPRRGGQ